MKIFIRSILNKILSNSRGVVFERLFNLKSMLLKTSNRIEFLPSKGHYQLKDTANRAQPLLIFYHEHQAAQAYARGLEFRSTALGNSYFLDQISFAKDDLVIDCGANVGDLFFWFKYRDIAINYLAYEPSLEEFRCLKENIFPHKAVNQALWFEDVGINFYLNSQDADSSLIQPSEYDDVQPIQAIPLESIITSKVKLLKLEAEGAEPEVIQGAGKKLEFIEFISADLGFERGPNNDSTFIEVTNYLLNNNFALLKFSDKRRCALFRNKKYFKPDSTS